MKTLIDACSEISDEFLEFLKNNKSVTINGGVIKAVIDRIKFEYDLVAAGAK